MFSRPSRRMCGAIVALAAVAMLAAGTGAPAQTPVIPREPVFGIGDTEFMIGGWNYPMPNDSARDVHQQRIDSMGQIIDWAHSLGIRVMRMASWHGWSHEFLTRLLDTARKHDTALRFVLYGQGSPDLASSGYEAKFYLTRDSVPYKVWQCKFLHLDGGTWAWNPDEEMKDEFDERVTEQIYRPDTRQPER